MHAIVKRFRGVLFDVVGPLILFYGLRGSGVSETAALVIGMVPPLVSSVNGLVRDRETDGFGILVLTAMLLSLGASLFSGSPRELLVRNALITAPLGIWVLISARRGTPMSFQVTRTLLPGRAGVMDRLWDEHPRFRRAWRQITVMWGILGLVDAAFRVYFALALPVSAVPVLDTAVTIVTVVALQIPTHVFILRSGCWLVLFDRRARSGYMASEPTRRRADLHANASTAAASHHSAE